MKVDIWKKGVECHLPALETFFKKVLLRKSKAELTGCQELPNKEAAELLNEEEFIIRLTEEDFQSEIFFGFDLRWGPLLAREILNSDEPVSAEITGELIREMVGRLSGLLTESFREVGIPMKMGEPELIRKGQLKRSLNLQEYLSASIQIEQKFELEGEADQEPLHFIAVVSTPDPDRVNFFESGFTDQNPFLNGDFEKASTRQAGSVEIKRTNGTDTGKSAGISVEGQKVEFEDFDRKSASRNEREVRNIDMLKDVQMDLSVELGRREMPLGKVLQLVKGSVIELEKLAGEPVEILVNGHKIAQGDVVVIDEHFGVRISHLLATQERIKGLS